VLLEWCRVPLGAGIVDPLRAPVGRLTSARRARRQRDRPGAVDLGLAVVGRDAPGLVDDPVRSVLAVALALAAAWLVALVLAGIAAAGRATLMTAELLRRAPAAGSLAESSPASPDGPARHAVAGPPVG
jgi:hypothetical protein